MKILEKEMIKQVKFDTKKGIVYAVDWVNNPIFMCYCDGYGQIKHKKTGFLLGECGKFNRSMEYADIHKAYKVFMHAYLDQRSEPKRGVKSKSKGD